MYTYQSSVDWFFFFTLVKSRGLVDLKLYKTMEDLFLYFSTWSQVSLQQDHYTKPVAVHLLLQQLDSTWGNLLHLQYITNDTLFSTILHLYVHKRVLVPHLTPTANLHSKYSLDGAISDCFKKCFQV